MYTSLLGRGLGSLTTPGFTVAVLGHGLGPDDRSAFSVSGDGALSAERRKRRSVCFACLFSFSQMLLSRFSLLQTSRILSQFLLLLSFLVLKNSQVSVFHLEGHFLGVSKLHHLQSSSGFCKRLSFFVVAGFLSTNCVQENKEVFRSQPSSPRLPSRHHHHHPHSRFSQESLYYWTKSWKADVAVVVSI